MTILVCLHSEHTQPKVVNMTHVGSKQKCPLDRNVLVTIYCYCSMFNPPHIWLCDEKVLQLWENPQSYAMGPPVKRILEKGLPVFPKLCLLETYDAIEFYDKFQELSTLHLLPIMPFDAARPKSNFEGLFIPGLGTERYTEIG